MLKLPFSNDMLNIAPTKIICLGRNYVKHAKEMKSEVPSKPIIFLKPPSSLIGPNEIIKLPKESKKVHHEVELAFLVSHKAKNVRAEKAMDYVLGYTILLDITARDIQDEAKMKGLPWTVAKGFDTFAPIGPRVVPADEINPNSLGIGLMVNGEIRQRGNTSDMIFKIPEIIEYVSSIMTLEPGDIIATGTPEGVGEIRDGDIIEAWIDGIGILKERVIRENP
jgi:2-keto-4-pentenoate hydratase/2-oxohepta-3-ene-1,7-dioic acid hydratase in catechol pathway